ncbi:hypothetical protein ACLB2K_044109 [Fragaria x ananassa]
MSTISPPPVTAGSSSSSSTFLQPPAPQLMTIKLTYYNYLLWKSLFIPVLEAYDMLNLAQGKEHCPPQFLTSEEENSQNPAYTSWIKRDKMFLTWINASLSPNLLRHTKDCTSGKALWLHLENLLAQSAKSHVLRLKARLQNLDTRGYYIEKYFKEAGEIANELEGAGSPVDERELISHIIKGLHPPYDELVSSVMSRPRPITRQELHHLLQSHEDRIAKQKHDKISRCVLRVICVIIFVFLLLLSVVIYFAATAALRYFEIVAPKGWEDQAGVIAKHHLDPQLLPT